MVALNTPSGQLLSLGATMAVTSGGCLNAPQVPGEKRDHRSFAYILFPNDGTYMRLHIKTNQATNQTIKHSKVP